MKNIFNTTKVKSDKVFLKRLSEWVLSETGDVNVAQRLNCIVIQGKLGKEGGNKTQLSIADGIKLESDLWYMICYRQNILDKDIPDYAKSCAKKIQQDIKKALK